MLQLDNQNVCTVTSHLGKMAYCNTLTAFLWCICPTACDTQEIPCGESDARAMQYITSHCQHWWSECQLAQQGPKSLL